MISWCTKVELINGTKEADLVQKLYLEVIKLITY